MYKVKILPSAKIDIKESAQWYNDQQKGLGKKFTAQIRKKINFIKQNPKAVPIRYDDITRTAITDVFPFMIHFMIENKTIIIKAVFHTSLNPKKWKNR